MTTALRPRTLVLFLGDVVFFTLALWLSLFVRTQELPSRDLFMAHLVPFSLLFVAWVVVYFIAGLYESRLLHYGRRQLTSTLLVAQLFNTLVAALFFFVVPLFGIAPKTLLVIYSIVSFLLVLFWRLNVYPLFGLSRQETALVVGEGAEINELVDLLGHAPRSPVRIVGVVEPSRGPTAIGEAIVRHGPSFVIAHWQDARVASAFSNLVNYITGGVRFVDAMGLYEEVFGRVPLSVLDEEWLARNVSRYAHTLYDPLKRLMDIAGGIAGGLISLVFYPFIIAAIKLEDGGPVFVLLPRVGENGHVFSIRKFRSMTGNDAGNYGAAGVSKLRVTRVGRVLRKFSLDELPQLWQVVSGDQSLIGPRPETPALVAQYAAQIPYYGVRHLIKPGLSGWAQIYHHNDPHHEAAVEATREKLSYDLYYLKHRSLMLDAAIVLKTLKKLLTRSGI